MTGGDWSATATLEANFADNTISVCIGCLGDTRLTERFIPDGLEFRPPNLPGVTRIHLGPASIAADGTFYGSDVTLSEPGIDPPAASSSGSWGRFSNLPFTNGMPVRTAGTVGGKADWSAGHTATFIGTFFATQQQ